MGFLNNSGDIVLDAVLTDQGRARLSKGDGSFKITKFALGDDEIDYSLYNPNTGSAYVDLQILQTPVLESFTNNFSSMKNKLLTINLKDILYLPVMKVNTIAGNGTPFTNKFTLNGYTIAVDKQTEDYLGATTTTISSNQLAGLLNGFTTATSKIVRVDQGIDSTAETVLPQELKETQYIIEMDNRLGVLTDSQHSNIAPSFIDDDDVATYYVSLGTNVNSVSENTVSSVGVGSQTGQVISGPRGTILQFGIQASLSAQTSTYLFSTIGTVYTGARSPSTTTSLYLINSNITITGGITGYSVVIPVVFAKLF